MNSYPWTLFFILLAGGVFASIVIIPYALAINPKALDQIREKQASRPTKIPAIGIVYLASAIQASLLIAIAIFVGLLATRAIGLGLPILQSALDGQPAFGKFLANLPVSLISGLAGGGILVVLEIYVFKPRLPALFNQVVDQVSLWKSCLACFYGGIYEELLMRLFVMSGLAWLLGQVWKSADGMPALGAFWLANFLATLLFGLGHLPATVRIARLTPLIVTRALVLNGLVGLIFGYLFMNYGLEAAMVAHFTTDVVIHVIAPRLASSGSKSKIQPAVS